MQNSPSLSWSHEVEQSTLEVGAEGREPDGREVADGATHHGGEGRPGCISRWRGHRGEGGDRDAKSKSGKNNNGKLTAYVVMHNQH